MGLTNSNSMTAILVVNLNNKKSGFRSKLISLLNLDEEAIFYDGTHMTQGFPELKNKEPDIYVVSGGKIKAFVEIKVGSYEELQPSQAIGGEYEATSIKYQIKLAYIIPNSYTEIERLPKQAQIIKWDDMYQWASIYDNTGLKEYILNFVELTNLSGSNIFTKGEVITMYNNSIIKDVWNTSEKILNLSRKCIESKNLIATQHRDKYGYGCYFDIGDNRYFLGLSPFLADPQFCLSLAIYSKKNGDSLYHDDEGWTYVSLQQDELFTSFLSTNDEEEQQTIFNKMVEIALMKIS